MWIEISCFLPIFIKLFDSSFNLLLSFTRTLKWNKFNLYRTLMKIIRFPFYHELLQKLGKDLNIKNKVKVYINRKSYINNWNKLALYFRISHIKSILINVYVYKSCKKVLQFVMWNDFPSFLYFLYFLPLHSWQTAIFWDQWNDHPPNHAQWPTPAIIDEL
jgi:hypothetical protein